MMRRTVGSGGDLSRAHDVLSTLHLSRAMPRASARFNFGRRLTSFMTAGPLPAKHTGSPEYRYNHSISTDIYPA
jgi:hypothetical protein